MAKCVLCHKRIRRGTEEHRSFSMTSLHNHAKVLHGKEYQDAKRGLLQGKTTEEASADDVSKKAPARERKIIQLSLQETFERRKLWDINDAGAKEVHKKILLMMAMDNQPFSMAEDDGFILSYGSFIATVCHP